MFVKQCHGPTWIALCFLWWNYVYVFACVPIVAKTACLNPASLEHFMLEWMCAWTYASTRMQDFVVYVEQVKYLEKFP